MTPQEKAIEIIDKFRDYSDARFNDKNNLSTEYSAKQCALIAVDEILFGLNAIADKYLELGMRTYWHEVKDEINKL
jgi:hypothetical protein